MRKRTLMVLVSAAFLLLATNLASAQPQGFYSGTIWGGKALRVGLYEVQTVGSSLYIKVWPIRGWEMVDVHIAIVTDPNDFPLNNGGNPKLNEFPWRASMAPTTVPYDITIPFSSIAPGLTTGDTVYIMIHTAMVLRDGAGYVIQDETGFGGPCGTSWEPGYAFPFGFYQLAAARWAWYFAFIL